MDGGKYIEGIKNLFYWKKKGSYTVESAFIIPMVLGIVFVIMYTLFILHDKVILQANLDTVIFLSAEGKEIEKKEYESYLSKALWITSVQEVQVKAGLLTVSGEVVASADLDIPVLAYFMSGKQEINISESYCKIQPEQVIRYGADVFKKKME